jgi:hypothetical protein
MAERVHAAVNGPESSADKPVVDSIARQPELEQLGAGDQSKLAACEIPHGPIGAVGVAANSPRDGFSWRKWTLTAVTAVNIPRRRGGELGGTFTAVTAVNVPIRFTMNIGGTLSGRLGGRRDLKRTLSSRSGGRVRWWSAHDTAFWGPTSRPGRFLTQPAQNRAS